jgi:hypothetical protein
VNTTNPHLDDEVLSAVIDGEASPAETAHASTCAECHDRLGHLLAAAAAVSPVPPPPRDAREAAIAAALSAALRLSTQTVSTEPVSPIRRVRRTRPLVLAAGAMAAALVVVAGVAALIGSTDDDQFAAVGRGNTAAGGGSADAGFLGAFDDEQDLARHLDAQLGADDFGVAPLSGDVSLDAESSPAAGEGASGGAAGERSEAATPPPAGSVGRLGNEAMQQCSTAMLEEFPDLGERLLVAAVVWHDEAAAVFVHRVASGERGLRAWIYAGDPCQLRTFISF